MTGQAIKKADIEQWGPIESRVLYMSFWFPAIARSAKTVWKAKWPELQGFLEEDRVTFYWLKAEGYRCGSSAIEKVILNRIARQRLWTAYTDNIAMARAWVNEVIGDCRAKRNLNDIQAHAGRLYKYIVRSWDLGIIPEIANYAAPMYLEQKLASYVSKSCMHEVLETLLAPEALSFHQESERALLYAALEKDDALFEAYSTENFYVENSYHSSRVITAEEGKQRVKNLSKNEIEAKLSAIADHPKEVKRRKSQVEGKYNIPTHVIGIANLLSHSIWWQDHRKGFAWWLDSAVDVLSHAAEIEFDLPFDDIMHYTAEEWVGLFDRKPAFVSEKVIAERKRFIGYEILPSKGKFSLKYGKFAQKLKRPMTVVAHGGSVSRSITGTPVSRGMARGMVKIILSPRKMHHMEHGEILVAPMTSPDYIVAMRKAAAIVTDVGDLMSHSAIISRELKIPCIVGTKTATTTLKDGDLVEVDANQGMIKLIKRVS